MRPLRVAGLAADVERGRPPGRGPARAGGSALISEFTGRPDRTRHAQAEVRRQVPLQQPLVPALSAGSDTAATVADIGPIDLAAGQDGASRLARLTAGFRDFARRRRTPIAIVGSLATAALLAFVLAGHRQEFAAALSSGAAAWVFAVTVLLQVVALLVRSEAWHLLHPGGGRDRRPPGPLSRVERAGARRGHQRTFRGRGANRGVAALLPGP